MKRRIPRRLAKSKKFNSQYFSRFSKLLNKAHHRTARPQKYIGSFTLNSKGELVYDSEPLPIVYSRTEWRKVVTVLGIHFERTLWLQMPFGRLSSKELQVFTNEEFMIRKLKGTLDDGYDFLDKDEL